MDALPLLQEVAAAYRNLETLAIEASLIFENGPEDHRQESQKRVTFIYAAPERMRYEVHDQMSSIEVSDGTTQRFFQSGFPPNLPARYTETPLNRSPVRLHSFSPDVPISYHAMLFERIAERVAGAEIIAEENGCMVVSVNYEPSQLFAMMTPKSPPLFWIDAQTRMVVRHETQVSMRLPETQVSMRVPVMDSSFTMRSTMLAQSIRINEPLPGDAFEFTVPDNVITGNAPVQCGMGGGTFAYSGITDIRRGIEYSDSNEWEGETLVQRTHLRVHGTPLVFERRITFADGKARVHVEERVSNGTAQAECECDLSLE